MPDKDLRRIIAGVERDPFQVLFMGIMRSEDEVLLSRGGGKGLRIYDELERDCHVFSVLQKRKMAVIGFPWEVEPATGSLRDRKAAETIEALFKSLDFDRICLGFLDAILKGYSVGEVIWDPATWLPSQIVMRDQRRFVMDQDRNPRLLTWQNLYNGEDLPERKFIVHRYGAKDDNPYGLGLGRQLFWPVFFKRQGLGFWLTFAEKFGSPTAMAKYPSGMPEPEQDRLLDTVSRIAQETAIITPLETEISLLEAARSGSVDTYERLCRYLDEEISKAVLGETLTTAMSQTGTYAASKTHNEVRLELVQSDADLLSGTMNATLIPWVTALHHPGANPPRVWRIVSEPEDLESKSKRDLNLVNCGFEPDDAYIRETYGDGWKKGEKAPVPSQLAAASPRPESGPAAPGSEDPQPGFAETPDKDGADTLTDRAEAEGGDAFRRLLAPVKRLVAQARSLEEVRDGLLDLYPRMDQAAFAEQLTQALSVAHLLGRFEVKRGR